MANFQSVYIIVIFLWIAIPEVIDSCGICYKKYVQRTGKCKRKISDGGRVIHMDFETCCRRKNAKAWQFKCGGGNSCIQCPEIVDGGWSKWTPWSKCPVSCDWGNHSRSRECNNPVPQHGGYECKGGKFQTRVCYAGRRCPIDGAWGSWGKWQACSRSCETGGLQFRSRRCDSPRAEFGGRHCVGASEESRSCNENIKCPVHGNWGSWGAWSACSPECTSVRKRKCDKPVPQHGGKACTGLALQKSSCPAYCTGTGSGSGEGSGTGSGSGSTGSGDVDVVVENSTSVEAVKPTKSTQKRPRPTASGEGSGEDGSGSQKDDNEPGDATDGGSGMATKNGTNNVAKEGGSGGSGEIDIDVIVEKAPNRTKEKNSVSGKVKVESAMGSGEDGSGSKNDDNESGDTTAVDGSGKVTKTGTKNSVLGVGSGGSGDSDIDVVVETSSQNRVEDKNTRRKPGWGKKFEVVKT